MGYLKVVVTGHSKSGGYITIMRPNMDYATLKREQKGIWNGNEFELSNGPQTIRYDSIGVSEREKVKLNLIEKKNSFNHNVNQYTTNRRFNEYYDAAAAADNLPKMVETTFDNITYNTLVTLSVSTDYNGRVVGSPNYTISFLSDEEVKEKEEHFRRKKEVEARAREERAKAREEERKEMKKKIVTKYVIATVIWLVIALISFFVAKYFMPIDRYNSNIFAIASFVCGIIGVVNLFKLIKRSCS